MWSDARVLFRFGGPTAPAGSGRRPLWSRVHGISRLGSGVVLAGLLASACAASPAPAKVPHYPPLQTPTPTAIPVGDGAVPGGIGLCAGVVPKVHPRFVAGTVKVYLGGLETEPAAPSGSFRYVLPAQVVAQAHVRVNQEFRFFLPPGTYVLVVGAPWFPVQVSVHLGQSSWQVISGGCI